MQFSAIRDAEIIPSRIASAAKIAYFSNLYSNYLMKKYTAALLLICSLSCKKQQVVPANPVKNMAGTHTWVGTDHYRTAYSNLDTIYNISSSWSTTVLSDSVIVLSDASAMFSNATTDTFHYLSRTSSILTFIHSYTDPSGINTQKDTLRYNYESNVLLWDYYYSSGAAYGDGHLHTP